MIKLNLPREPYWITLAAGVRLQVRPATTALVMAARHAASKVAGTDTAAAGERTATLITELAKLAVLSWEGVADEKGKPAAVTPEGVAALMEHWLLADAFEREYLAGLYALDSEKKRLKARTAWHFGGGPSYCSACPERCPECPYTMNAPESLEGWQAASAIEVCASQLRMAQGRVVGLDLNAWMLACESTGLDKTTAIDLFPAVEAGLMSTLQQDE